LKLIELGNSELDDTIPKLYPSKLNFKELLENY